jgi:hypothetical protein
MSWKTANPPYLLFSSSNRRIKFNDRRTSFLTLTGASQISWKDNDAETYQKELCGFDFAEMSKDQVIEAIKKIVAQWNDQIEKMKKS